MAVPTRDLGRTAPAGGPLPRGLGAGRLDVDPLEHGPRTGRARRWAYAAAAGEDLAIGAAVVEVGPVGTAFVWATLAGRTRTWERRALLRRGLAVGAVPAEGASFRGGGADITLHGDGGFRFDVPLEGGERLRADVTAGGVTPVVLVTGTPGGGWNATEKAAGYATDGWCELAGRRVPVRGGGWRDWTAGRQDRRTTWRWAAGAGTSVEGHRVGFNVSTGMNGQGDGEDVVWFDGTPRRLEVTTLAPAGRDPAGAWRVGGPGWSLELEPWGVRAADEDLWLVRSHYVQPIGRFRGTLPGPDGVAVALDRMVGVTEHHEATW